MKITTIRLEESKVEELERMAYALSLAGHKGSKRKKVSVSDIIRTVMDKYKTDDKAIGEIIKTYNSGGVK